MNKEQAQYIHISFPFREELCSYTFPFKYEKDEEQLPLVTLVTGKGPSTSKPTNFSNGNLILENVISKQKYAILGLIPYLIRKRNQYAYSKDMFPMA
ncbi:hypothetical protein DW991_05055 [Bacteroides thetaiotaomicron]|nr:hypothetical protein DW991_05055 [Bacteroides thetaiotaomicron]